MADSGSLLKMIFRRAPAEPWNSSARWATDWSVCRGDGYYISRTANEIQIYLYNYSHYDLLYRYRHVVNLSRTNRYDVFVSKEPRAFYIRFENMEAGTYEMKSYRITKDGGSSYDIWLKMGAPEPLTSEEVTMLQTLSEPLYRRESAEVKEVSISWKC